MKDVPTLLWGSTAMNWSRLLSLALLALCCCGISRAESPAPVYLGLDGEYGLLHSTSAQAIERGIRTAMHEINAGGGVLGGRPLEVLIRDNRSVPARGVDNVRRFAEVPDLVAVMGGRFSPVILEELPIVHQLGVILLDPWGSADGITEHDYHPSYTFRLSLKDRLAMPAMLRFAVSRGAERVALLLPNTGWGRSNLNAARRYEEKHALPKVLDPVWYNWGERDMLRHYRKALANGAQALVLVANDLEGSVLVRQMAELPATDLLPVISHWGVTGGRMVENSGEALQRIDFTVVQTFSLFTAEPAVRDRVMAVARDLFGVRRIEDVESPVGFGHAYDLVHILARAIDLAGTTDRAAVRGALEQVRDYRGLTGYYPRPFSPEDHDALRAEQVFMARFRRDGVIVPLAVDPGIP